MLFIAEKGVKNGLKRDRLMASVVTDYSFLNPFLLHQLHYLILAPSLIAQIFADDFIDVVLQVHLTVLLVLATL